jgi:APA family basic amino acid/polyamine antiporter
MWGYPVVPITFIVSSFAIVINQILRDPVESLTGLAMVLIGVPVYIWWTRRVGSPRSGSSQKG